MENRLTQRPTIFLDQLVRKLQIGEISVQIFPQEIVQTWAPTTTIWGSWMASDPTVLNTSWSLLITGISWSIYLRRNNNIVLCRFTDFSTVLFWTSPKTIAEHRSISFVATLLTKFWWSQTIFVPRAFRLFLVIASPSVRERNPRSSRGPSQATVLQCNWLESRSMQQSQTRKPHKTLASRKK